MLITWNIKLYPFASAMLLPTKIMIYEILKSEKEIMPSATLKESPTWFYTIMSAVDVLHHVTSSRMFNEVNWPGKCLPCGEDSINKK